MQHTYSAPYVPGTYHISKIVIFFSGNPLNSPNVVWTQNDKKNDEETWYTVKGGKISDFYFRLIFKNAWITLFLILVLGKVDGQWFCSFFWEWDAIEISFWELATFTLDT